MPWAAVIGDPIEHSLSPALHREAYRLLDLDWEYGRFRVTARDVPSFMANLPADCVGLSVTMPCKRAILGSVDARESLAKLLGVGNTVVIQGGLRAAFNTDVAGIVGALQPALENVDEAGETPPGKPVVIGNGATACSALAALATLGYRDVVVAARNLAGADGAYVLAQKLGINAQGVLLRMGDRVAREISSAPVLISTVPPGATADLAAYVRPGQAAVMLDVTYTAEPRPLADAFAAAGASVQDPLSMLTHQGIAQVKLMTDREVPYQPVYEAVRAAAMKARD